MMASIIVAQKVVTRNPNTEFDTFGEVFYDSDKVNVRSYQFLIHSQKAMCYLEAPVTD